MVVEVVVVIMMYLVPLSEDGHTDRWTDVQMDRLTDISLLLVFQVT